MRTALLRLAIALPAAFVIYSGWYWASRAGSGCSPAHEDKLAVIGYVLIALAALALAGAALRRLALGGALIAMALVLLVYGFATALGCLQ